MLDEPNSNLDQDGDDALMRTLAELKRQGRTIVVITHRHNLLTLADRILLLVDGQIAMYGDRDKVLAALQQGMKPRPVLATSPARAARTAPFAASAE